MSDKIDIDEGRRLHREAFCAPWKQEGPFRVGAEDECSEDCEQDHDAVSIEAPEEYPGGQCVAQHVALTCIGLSGFAQANGALIVWLRNNGEALLDAAEERDRLRDLLHSLEWLPSALAGDCCPVCHGSRQRDGHDRDCRLVIALKGGE